ncbi:hypothetical protein V0M98_38920 (plasmid) [Pseudomonas silesiensis]|uniref:hypothetical protein n=1 Tax=Pseudomonas silesiensis TaxID=1853130 RepID=UPI0030CB9945
MDDSAVKSTVLSLDSARNNSAAKAELLGIHRGMQFFSWDMLVSKVFNFCGLALSEAFLSNDAITPAPNSVAAELGHTTMESLVSKSEAEFGLGHDWAEFKKQAMALIYLGKYALSASASYQEILDQVEDTAKILKRAPGNAAEFHSAKEKALNDNIIEMRRDHETKMTDARDRQQDLTRTLDKTKAKVISLEASTQTLKQDSAARIQQITREMAERQEALEQQHSQRVREACLQVEQEFERKIAGEKFKFEALVAAAVSERQSAEQAVNEYKNRLSSGDLVEASVLATLKGKLEEAVTAEADVRGRFMELSDELTQTHKRLEIMSEENTLLQSKIDNLNEQIGQLEISMRELVEQRSGSAEFAVLHERLEMRKQEIVKLRNELEKELKARTKAEGKLSKLEGRFTQLRDQGNEIIKSLNQKILNLNVQYAGLKTENVQVKVALGVLAVLAAVLSATVWAVMPA